MLVRNSVIIRIYVLQLRNLTRKDINESEPYIKIYIGDTLKIDERKKCLSKIRYFFKNKMKNKYQKFRYIINYSKNKIKSDKN